MKLIIYIYQLLILKLIISVMINKVFFLKKKLDSYLRINTHKNYTFEGYIF